MKAAGALADPVRRQIVALPACSPTAAGAVAATFPIGRPAVIRQLRVLREHGVVTDEQRGRVRVHRLDQLRSPSSRSGSARSAAPSTVART